METLAFRRAEQLESKIKEAIQGLIKDALRVCSNAQCDKCSDLSEQWLKLGLGLGDGSDLKMGRL